MTSYAPLERKLGAVTREGMVLRWLAWMWVVAATTGGVLGMATAYRDPSILRIDAFTDIYSAAGLSDRLMMTVALVLPMVGAILVAAFMLGRRGAERAPVVFAVGLVGIFFYASGAALGLSRGIGNLMSSASLVLMAVFLVTFPSGTFRPRWGAAAPALTVVLVVFRLDLGVEIRLAMGNLQEFADSVLAGFGLGTIFAIAAVSQVVRYRLMASRTERYQARWILAALVVMLTPPIVFLVLSALGLASSPAVGYAALVTTLGSFALPVAVAIAAFRYNLYEIDRIISRTLTYGLVAIIVTGVYAVTVVLLPAVLGADGPVFVAGATLAAAATFDPVRRRVQGTVDRRFNRTRYDSERELVALTTELASVTEISEVQLEVAGALGRTVQPATLSWWFSDDGFDDGV